MTTLEKILQEIDKNSTTFMDGDKRITTEKVKEIIKKNISAKDINIPTNDGWIPCSERMPEEPGDYRVTVMEKWKWGEVNYYTDFAYFPGEYIDDNWDTMNDWIEGQEVHVIAWKKIEDEPYIQEEESADGKRMREREEFFKDGE